MQRNINQEQRIDNGVDNGSLTASEAGQLEAGQGRTTTGLISGSGRNGTINANEQQGNHTDENGQSINIRDDRQNSTSGHGQRKRSDA